MKVGELIEKLGKVSPDLVVTVWDCKSDEETTRVALTVEEGKLYIVNGHAPLWGEEVK